MLLREALLEYAYWCDGMHLRKKCGIALAHDDDDGGIGFGSTGRRERLTSKDDGGGDTGEANDGRPACARVGQVQVHVVHIVVVILLLLIVVCHGELLFN
jgi:hypothetical protein